ncbi:MAG: glutathione synthase, partial [Myxococcota bacterium]|nr:glutathione synthase [Myxococcota bacterium]
MASTIAFVMDPMEGIGVEADTSFAFMLAAQSQGSRVFHVSPGDISLHGADISLGGRFVEVFDRVGDHFRVVETARIWARDCHAIFIRTDPPFDEDYLMATWLLSFAERQGVRVVNSPAGIRAANEKLYALEFAEHCPTTLVTSSQAEVLQFLESYGGSGIVKPLNGHGGFGVLKVSTDDSNTKAIIDLLTHEGDRPILVQEFLPEAAQGDKRIILVDGTIRGGIMRVPREDDHRGNVHVGGQVVSCEIDEADRKIEEAMSERLRADGLYFVGIDVIAGKLIEVNVTSPTLVREIKRLGGPDIATEVIRSL